MASYFKKGTLCLAELGTLISEQVLYPFTAEGDDQQLGIYLYELLPKHQKRVPIYIPIGGDEAEKLISVAQWNNAELKWDETDIPKGILDENTLWVRKISLPEQGETYTAVFGGQDDKQIKFTYGENHTSTINWLKSQFTKHPIDGVIALRLRHAFYETGDHFYLYMFWKNGTWSHTKVCMEGESTFDNAIILLYEPNM